MKKLLIIFMVLLLVVGCGKKKEETKVEENVNETKETATSLVVYFSVTNNTEGIAKIIGEETNSDIIEIVPKEAYSSDDINYNDNNSRANKEQNDSKSRPEIKNEIDFSKYDTIYLGYPIWWGTIPRIIYTLLDTYNLEDKNIVLFCTSGSTDIDKSVSDIKKYNSKLNIIDSKRFSASASKEEVKNWLDEIELPSSEKVDKLKVTINNKEYTINLEDNDTAQKLVEMAPLEVTMKELNGNEKYYYFDTNFPEHSYKPGRIEKGDVMLYDGNCLVIFYESLNSKYEYTKIGHIDNLPNLGKGDITVKIEK